MDKARISLFLLPLFFSCNSETMVDVYREGLKTGIEGEVKRVELYKGKGTRLVLKSKGKTQSIGLDNEFFRTLRKGDYFVKKEKSNECIVQRKDSIIYLDCFDIQENLRDSLGTIKEWPLTLKARWKTKR